MARRRRPSLVMIQENPTLHERAFALVVTRFPRFKWHMHVDSPDSSQAFALSAFLPLLELPDKDVLLERFVGTALPALSAQTHRCWDVIPEFESPRVLGETGRGEATKVDILLVADDAVVCVESKFRVDARQGWGKCSQPPRLCEGFYGPGSDRKGTHASCRLELPDGDRGPRRYWEVARGHFREAVFDEQGAGDACPLRSGYQLARNYLFAAEYARMSGKKQFGVIGIAPSGVSKSLAAGVEQFTERVLRPDHVGRVGVATYEEYVTLLAVGSAGARELAAFLAPLLTPDLR